MVGTQTSVTGGAVTIVVGGHTQLDGAVIAAVDAAGSDTGALTPTTDTLGVTDVLDEATSTRAWG